MAKKSVKNKNLLPLGLSIVSISIITLFITLIGSVADGFASTGLADTHRLYLTVEIAALGLGLLITLMAANKNADNRPKQWTNTLDIHSKNVPHRKKG